MLRKMYWLTKKCLKLTSLISSDQSSVWYVRFFSWLPSKTEQFIMGSVKRVNTKKRDLISLLRCLLGNKTCPYSSRLTPPLPTTVPNSFHCLAGSIIQRSLCPREPPCRFCLCSPHVWSQIQLLVWAELVWVQTIPLSGYWSYTSHGSQETLRCSFRLQCKGTHFATRSISYQW